MESLDDLKGRLKFDKNHRLVLGIVPMILTPRWFFVNIQKELEKAGGLELAKRVYYRAGFESAYKFCQMVRRVEKTTGKDIIERYLGSMSLRGWGRFEIVQLDVERGVGFFRLYGSAFCEEYGPMERTVCHCWPGALAGAIKEIIDARALNFQIKGREAKCKARGEQYCEFVVKPIRKAR